MKITPLDTPQAREIARRITSGTTTKPEDLQVLWIGVNLCLVKQPGGHYSDNGGTHYQSAWCVLTNVENGISYGDPRHYDRTIWECQRGKHGPLTYPRLQTLIEKCEMIDLAFPEFISEKIATHNEETALRNAFGTTQALMARAHAALVRAAMENDDPGLIAAAADYRDSAADHKSAGAAISDFRKRQDARKGG